MKLSCCALLLFLFFTSTVSAQLFLSLETVHYQPGDPLSFSMYGSDIVMPATLTCQLAAGGVNETVVATLVDETTTDQLKGYSYQLPVPAQLSGLVTLTVLDVDLLPVQFFVRDSEGGQGVSIDGQEDYPSFSSLFTLYQPYMASISAYEPMYFLLGVDPEESKYQISFKYRLFNPEGSLSAKMPWLQGLHLSYTQTSFWDLQSESSPFQDTSYKPELFFLSSNSPFRSDWADGLFFQFGYQHESNGRAEPGSRSTNYLYLITYFIFYDEDSQLGLQIAPKVWTYVGNDNETNPDLDDYRGYFELEAKVGKADGLVLGTYFRWAEEGASLQADLTYPMHQVLGNNLGIYLHLQYVNALAESLLNYQDRTETVRIGFSIVR